jgi:hypothetical protein
LSFPFVSLDSFVCISRESTTGAMRWFAHFYLAANVLNNSAALNRSLLCLNMRKKQKSMFFCGFHWKARSILSVQTEYKRPKSLVKL